MKANSLFVFTHDSIGLGEDGPTHEPVEHLMALRAVPNMTDFRPAKSIEQKYWPILYGRRVGVLLVDPGVSMRRRRIQGVRVPANSRRKYAWRSHFYGAGRADEFAIPQSQLLPEGNGIPALGKCRQQTARTSG